MSILAAATAVGGFLLDNLPILEAVADAIAGGSPTDAIVAGIRGVQLKTSRDAVIEELHAAEERREVNKGEAAYAAWCVAMGAPGAWSLLNEENRAAWEAAADAARAS